MEFTWQRKCARYQAEVRKLYTIIEGWFAPYVQQGVLSVARRRDLGSESSVGTYDVEVMELSFSEQTIILRAGSVCVAGTKGVIDVLTGERRPPVATLALVDEGGRLQWLLRRPDDRRFDYALNRGLLEQLIDENLRT